MACTKAAVKAGGDKPADMTASQCKIRALQHFAERPAHRLAELPLLDRVVR